MHARGPLHTPRQASPGNVLSNPAHLAARELGLLSATVFPSWLKRKKGKKQQKTLGLAFHLLHTYARTSPLFQFHCEARNPILANILVTSVALNLAAIAAHVSLESTPRRERSPRRHTHTHTHTYVQAYYLGTYTCGTSNACIHECAYIHTPSPVIPETSGQSNPQCLNLGDRCSRIREVELRKRYKGINTQIPANTHTSTWDNTS
ncbi:hypothetical protein GGS23DRAFT_490066 [Durotheca rogersii]|uniref:uncharacterized protein n=1 Tax=Durotheca rogersii TaxID=419775 RepID=UPI00221FD810|nr:uncharacterized protein GGS23DRAFT_490066 [Durotheca rogersii]KAI5864254.1 hypothetical protein GGS23DRAFT_490066 [Durotheca rogersii]